MRILPEKSIPSIVLLLASTLCYSSTQAAAFPAQFDPRRMSADEGWLFTGSTTESAMGGVAQGIGDINADGYTDFIIGTGPYQSRALSRRLPASFRRSVPAARCRYPGSGECRQSAPAMLNSTAWRWTAIRCCWDCPMNRVSPATLAPSLCISVRTRVNGSGNPV